MDALRISTAVIGTLIYIAGFMGNFFASLLFVQKELRQVSTGLLFLLLNITNTIHLLSLIFEFIDSLFLIQIFPSDVFRCQFILWLQNATRTICSFLATTVSVDRFLRSEYPILSRRWCIPKNAFKLSIIYLLFSILLYAFFFYPLNTFDDEGFCTFGFNGTFHIFAVYVMPPIRFTLICIIPTTIMIVCGCRMVYNIGQSRKRVAQQTIIQNQTLTTTVASLSTSTSIINNDRRQNITTDRTLLLMVILNIIAYIITQLPFNSYSVYYGYEATKNNLSYSLTRSFLLMWSSVYFGVSFYLFSCASRQFRKQFLTRIKTIDILRRFSQRRMFLTRNN
ncbi:unnamed protein product [Rotaria sp. Silwood2]|nr:unnamed protein product [Rotaria sp. Silwood2]CAF2583079.1 unnamed protein product [Rotaria sp. Silwood2]CAF2855812.1 unnamed protein product [Rotaria sp. Silwood2]CAF3013606.1 unnamed protein product [Rotaria sp. Silwood2]CAF3950958.1 unnamed protein product [Rotaria sp. Silwood2]